MTPTNPQAPAFDFRSYAEGGMVGPGGMPQRPAGLTSAGPEGPMNPQMLQGQIQDLLSKNPAVMGEIQAAIQRGLQSGELTMQELNQGVQLAQMAAQNPQMWPQVVQYAEAQGLVEPGELPQQYDQGLVIALLIAGRAAQQGGSMPAQNQQPVRSYAQGGPLPTESKNADGSVPIKAHEGEYVIPAHVVRAKGTEFFDKLIEGASNKGSSK